jgi:hypothetical protein
MQVEREAPSGVDSGARVRNTWITYLLAGDNHWKRWLIPHKTTVPAGTEVKDLSLEDGSASD